MRHLSTKLLFNADINYICRCLEYIYIYIYIYSGHQYFVQVKWVTARLRANCSPLCFFFLFALFLSLSSSLSSSAAPLSNLWKFLIIEALTKQGLTFPRGRMSIHEEFAIFSKIWTHSNFFHSHFETKTKWFWER